MKQHDFSKKITYTQALILPLKIEPVASAIQLANNLIKLALPPLGVLAAARFIDTAIFAVSSGSGNFVTVIVWLAALLAIRTYGYIEEPVFSILNKKRSMKEWHIVDYPAIKSRACLDVCHTEKSETSDLINRISSPGGALLGMLWNMVGFVVFIGQIAGYVAILVFNAPLAGLIIVLSAVPVIIVAGKSAKAEYKAKRDITKQERLVWALHGHLSDRDSACERAMFGFEGFLDQKFQQEFSFSRNYVLKTVINWELRKSVSGIMITVLSAIALFVLLPSVSAGKITVGLYISLISVIFTAARKVAFDLSSYFENFAKDKEFLREYNEYISLSRNPSAVEPMAQDIPEFKSLEFRDVSFTYPGTEVRVLKGVSFKIEAGKRYSLIGVNGSGKSTVVKLILRLYESFDGEILLNGSSILSWDIAKIKAMVGAVFQDFAKFDLSLAENISGGSGMRADDGDIDNAIRVSGLEETVSRLPAGKETMLGKVYENGEELSGGQWQKIALARAVISRSQLKILDEPTASLDPMAECEVYKKFEELSRQSATIFISHRLASCVDSDVIYLLDEGRIVETGSHSQLMERNGRYHEMFESQRGWYI